jgi:ectoine hydroxylase-related dioxygenase (phytanoyl-CoA dioxygenase family)
MRQSHAYRLGEYPTFQEKGYVVAQGILNASMAKELKERIKSQIGDCAQQLGYTTKDYLSAVSRWVAPSPVTSPVDLYTLNTLEQAAQSFAGKPVQLKKMNVICKNAHCTGSIAYHQDICYSPEEPYEFSIWLALDDVPLSSAPLEVIPSSHLLPLKPAIDFWSPHYEEDPSLKPSALKLPVKAGDAIFFDSRLWHGSGNNKAPSSRYALVTRWVSEGWGANQSIPTIEPDFFGMWTCGAMTEKLLSQGLKILYNISISNFIKLIDTWTQIIQENTLPFVINVGSTLESFKNLKILHLAHKYHHGGDAIGIVYKSLWHTLLAPLEEYLENIEKERNVG